MKITEKARKENYQRYLNALSVYLTAVGWIDVSDDMFGSCWVPPGAPKGTAPYTLETAAYRQTLEDKRLGGVK